VRATCEGETAVPAPAHRSLPSVDPDPLAMLWADDGRSCVFDVRDEGDPARWFVVKVYD